MRKISFGKIFIVFDLFSTQEIKFIQDTLQPEYWQKDDLSDNKVLNLSDLQNINQCRDVAQMLTDKGRLLKGLIEEDFGCEISPEALGTIISFHSGWNLPLHCDSWSNLPTHSGYPSRDISSVVYLTGGFDGGNLVFPNLNIQIEPLAGSVVYFPSGEDYMHTVTELVSGDRWVCTSFWNILSS